MDRFTDKVAIVTGAARGLGRGIAERLAAEGAVVVVTDVDAEGARQTAQELGGKAIGIGCDVSDYDSVEAMVAQVTHQLGRVDVLVNNAGWDKAAPFLELERDLWPKIIGINLFGVLNTSRAVLPIMVGQGGGSLVNISSDAGRVGSSGEAVYSAAKGGIIAFTKSTAREMARSRIRVNCICPGPSDTQLFAEFAGEHLREALTKAIPMRRLGQPEDVAGAVAYFASDDAAYVTGQTISVSGGLTMS